MHGTFFLKPHQMERTLVSTGLRAAQLGFHQTNQNTIIECLIFGLRCLLGYTSVFARWGWNPGLAHAIPVSTTQLHSQPLGLHCALRVPHCIFKSFQQLPLLLQIKPHICKSLLSKRLFTNTSSLTALFPLLS